jgi:hypothetical protein
MECASDGEQVIKTVKERFEILLLLLDPQSKSISPRIVSGWEKLSFPLFGKEGLGEISAVSHGFTSPKKSPLVPLWQRGKLLLTRLLSQLRYGLFKGEKFS